MLFIVGSFTPCMLLGLSNNNGYLVIMVDVTYKTLQCLEYKNLYENLLVLLSL